MKRTAEKKATNYSTKTRRQTEDHAVNDGERQRKQEDARIRLRAQAAHGRRRGQKAEQQIAGPVSRQDAEQSAGQREAHAFGEQLAQQAAASRADRQPDGDQI